MLSHDYYENALKTHVNHRTEKLLSRTWNCFYQTPWKCPNEKTNTILTAV